MKKCPPGVICVENVSLFFIVSVICIIGYIIYSQKIDKNVNERKIIN